MFAMPAVRNQSAEQEVASNRLLAPNRVRHDSSTIKVEIDACSQAACGSILTLGKNTT